LITRLLERAWVYWLWAKMMSSDKIKILKKELKYLNFKTIADLGCGSAINTHLFSKKEYLGIDINPKYIEYAKRRYPSATYITADIASDNFVLLQKIDMFLLNSMLHHLSDEEVHRVLKNVKNNLSNKGKVLIIDNILPSKQKKIKNWFIRHDRGKFVRLYEGLRKICEKYFKIEKSYIFEAKLVYLFKVWELCLFVLAEDVKKQN
jgi:SAM-dependent methyltransferase